MARDLSPIYLDGVAVPLGKRDPKPSLARIARAGGRDQDADAIQLDARTATHGKPLHAEDIVDRTEHPEVPIYLRSKPPQDSNDAERDLGPLDKDGMPVAFAPTLTWYAKQEEARRLGQARRGSDAPELEPGPRHASDSAQGQSPRPVRKGRRTH